MAGTLKFSPEGLARVVTVAQAAHSGVLLAKDQGVYLMVEGTGGDDVVIAYAEGMDPKKDDFEDWWHNAQRVCGGDDFGEDMDVAFLGRVVAKGKGLAIRVHEDSLEMEEA